MVGQKRQTVPYGPSSLASAIVFTFFLTSALPCSYPQMGGARPVAVLPFRAPISLHRHKEAMNVFLILVLLMLLLVKDGKATFVGLQHPPCNAHLVSSSDLGPTVFPNATVIMEVTFNSSSPLPHPVIWHSASLNNYTDLTNDLITVYNGTDGGLSTYQTTFTVFHVTDHNWGQYSLSVCNQILQYFTIFFDTSSDCDKDPPDATDIIPSDYIGPVGVNRSISSFFSGDNSLFDVGIVWECSGEEISDDEKHVIRTSVSKKCSLVSTLTLVNVTSADSTQCQCYAVTQDGSTVGKNQTSTNKFVDYPAVLENPFLRQQKLYPFESLRLSWRVTGSVSSNNQYILPIISVNGVYLNISDCNCDLHFEPDPVLSGNSYLVLTVNKIKDIKPNHTDTLQITAYLKFQPIVSNVDQYNNLYANHSQPVIIVIKPVWIIVLSVIGTVAVVVSSVVMAVFCIRKRQRRQRNGYQRIVEEPVEPDRPDNRGNELIQERANLLTIAEEEVTQHPGVSQPEEDYGAASHGSQVIPGMMPTGRSHETSPPLASSSSSSRLHSNRIETNYLQSPKVVQSRGGASPVSPHYVVPKSCIRQGLMASQRPANPSKQRVSASDEEEDTVEADRPVTVGTRKPYNVFIIYCKTAGGPEPFSSQIHTLAYTLNLFSYKEQSDRYYTCTADVLLETDPALHVTNWSNWTNKKIQEATHVIVVCTPELFDSLNEPAGTTFEMHRGPVSSNMVSNLFTDKKNGHKFIPVFLNSPRSIDLVPTALRTKKCYMLQVNSMLRAVDVNNVTESKAAEIQEYLQAHSEMSDFVDLIKLLRNEEWC